ncbi:acyl-[acyl-carrier-protein] thioesterase [Thermophagus sp. OGC60D27]|uniref:acyl-[acyl-carrier-protein] thioesterase n=1 Tax=Thermophagus sp. OGC60D27 TaxID=3458415 RepID=UPI004037F07D
MNTDIWEEPVTISSFDVGASGRLEPSALMKHLQEAAAKHAIGLGVGFDDLRKDNIFWALTHLQVEILNWPSMMEKVTIETWPRNIQKLYSTRDFLIKDHQNRTLVKASSAWIMVDILRKRPIRPYERLHNKPFVTHRMALGEFPKTLSHLPDSINMQEHRRQVVYSDLDFNHHVNNTRYMEWLMDAIAPEGSEIASFNIHFTNEFKKGESVIIKTGYPENDSNNLVFVIDHESTGKTGCSGEICFRQISLSTDSIKP